MIARRATAVAITAAALVVAYLAGGAAARPAPEPSPALPVNVVIYYGEAGEMTDVELWDQGGTDVPVGSIAESWPDPETDSED